MDKEYNLWFCSHKAELELDLVTPISNAERKPKGGLWCSPSSKENICAWNDWCVIEEFRQNKYIQLISVAENTRFLIIDKYEDYERVMSQYKRDNIQYNFYQHTIDYEKISKDYDVVYINPFIPSTDNFWSNLDEFIGWDVETFLVLNKECITGVQKTITLLPDGDKKTTRLKF